MMKMPKSFLVSISISSFVFLITASSLLNSCKNSGSTSYKLTGNTIEDGQHLVQTYCTTCHELVPANALTKDVWHYHILPDMSKFFGMGTYGTMYYKKDGDTTKMTLPEWSAIGAYYDKVAPSTLAAAKASVPLLNDWAGFGLKMPAVKDTNDKFTSMVVGNPYNHKIYSSDLATRKLYEWDEQLHPKIITELPTEAVDGKFEKDSSGKISGTFSCIGDVIALGDFPNGRLINVDLSKDVGKQTTLATDLARPLQSVSGDFNKDGLADWVVCGPGFTQGGVYLLTQKGDHTYTKTTLSDNPGSVQALTGDFDRDGWTDVMVLFGAGDEGLYLFSNNHKGGFNKKALLRFPPVYSSTSFQLADINHDGKPDLIYTAGYNFRNSRILKPYHGLYIFINEGNWQFKQRYFYPINGCTKAIAADFDGDGDLDIATCAFFADMKDNPAESFIYFEQDGQLYFKPHAIPVSKYGRWMSMDVTDYNNDGKPDIVLGNYSRGFMFQSGFTPAWDKKIPLIVLENQIPQKQSKP